MATLKKRSVSSEKKSCWTFSLSTVEMYWKYVVSAYVTIADLNRMMKFMNLLDMDAYKFMDEIFPRLQLISLYVNAKGGYDDMDKFINEIENHNYFKFIFSSPFDKGGFKKVVFRAVGDCENLDKCEWLCESFTETQVFHRGISADDLKGELVRVFGQFKQCCLMSECETVTAFNNKGNDKKYKNK